MPKQKEINKNDINYIFQLYSRCFFQLSKFELVRSEPLNISHVLLIPSVIINLLESN